MHVLTPTVFDLLDDLVRRDVRELGQIQLTTALNALARREKYLALETRGSRHNLGVKFGVVEAQIALALAGVDREQMLAGLLESIVRIEQNRLAMTSRTCSADRPDPTPSIPTSEHRLMASTPAKLLIETITSADPALRDRSVRELVAGASLAEKLAGVRRARAVPPGRATTSTSGSGPRCSSTRSTATTSRTRRGPAGHGADPVRRVQGPDGAAVRAGDRVVPRGDAATTGPTARSASALAQAYEQVAYQTLADQVRAVGPELPGQPLDVPGRRRGRASRSGSTPGSSSASRTTRSSRSWSSGRRSGSTSRTAPGPTSSSWAWTTPRGPGC